MSVPPRPPDPAPYRALVRPPGARHIEALDQRMLPHAAQPVRISDADAAALAIRRMWVRGAPLIGAVGAYGLAMALDRDASDLALARAHAALDAVGAAHLAARAPYRLSGGEKRAVALAGVLAMAPSVLVLDEPTSALDPSARRRLIGWLRGFAHTRVIATHDLDLVLDPCAPLDEARASRTRTRTRSRTRIRAGPPGDSIHAG